MPPDYSVMMAKFRELKEGWEVDVEPPPEGPTSGSGRQIEGSGSYRYVFGENEGGAYLEYYSFHRIWGDSHVRIYEDGEVEWLDTLGTTMVVTGDATEDAESQEKLHRYNQRLLADLEEAGLLSGGPVPNSFIINSAIVSGLVDPDEEVVPEPPANNDRDSDERDSDDDDEDD